MRGIKPSPLVEHLVEAQGVVGPIPTSSTIRVSTHSWRLQRPVGPVKIYAQNCLQAPAE